MRIVTIIATTSNGKVSSITLTVTEQPKPEKNIEESTSPNNTNNNITSNDNSQNVIVIKDDETNVENEVDIIIVYFHVPFETCIARNNTRTGRECVPMDAMKRMNRQHELPAIEYKNHVATYIVRD